MRKESMKFKQFVLPTAIRDLENVRYPFPSKEDMTEEERNDYVLASLYQTWCKSARPYYRLYPSALEKLLSLDLGKLLNYPFSGLPFGLDTLELEIPEAWRSYLSFTSCIFHCKSLETNSSKDVCFVAITTDDGEIFPFGGVRDTFIETYNKGDMEPVYERFFKLLYGVLMIGENPDIVKPIPLSKDKQRYERTLDKKYIERARRRGVFGFDIGKDIPTQEEIKKMIAENEEAERRGRVRPHVRTSYLAIRWTGKGGAIPKMVKVKSCLVNKDLLTTVPQGYYGKE